MNDEATHRDFKNRLYEQFARVGKAIASPARIEFLELLAQGERTVDSLAKETGLSLANASQHLIALREAGLVLSRKAGLSVHYRLADPSVFELTRAMRIVAERRLAEIDRLVAEHFVGRADSEAVSFEDLLAKARSGEVVVLDTRPAHEYEAGHIEGAVSAPVDALQARLRTLPKSKEYVAYCRGPYCVYADQAVELLRANGRTAHRLQDGYPEWKAAGLPVETV
ncbi:MAG: metalloregulator ArsR/SmtB family transcription factor [Devosia nanyangense]|uniref:Metalloregulator ArsR/SmtB family transcription factor n=1 Tax=Devosia nanyangense TaxID=1228055 RepID=A0A933L1T3_9HYPH|nr:metalloregulator ArsR/SmtB family transcription factor [Devosia nanyangense]